MHVLGFLELPDLVVCCGLNRRWRSLDPVSAIRSLVTSRQHVLDLVAARGRALTRLCVSDNLQIPGHANLPHLESLHCLRVGLTPRLCADRLTSLREIHNLRLTNPALLASLPHLHSLKVSLDDRESVFDFAALQQLRSLVVVFAPSFSRLELPAQLRQLHLVLCYQCSLVIPPASELRWIKSEYCVQFCVQRTPQLMSLSAASLGSDELVALAQLPRLTRLWVADAPDTFLTSFPALLQCGLEYSRLKTVFFPSTLVELSVAFLEYDQADEFARRVLTAISGLRLRDLRMRCKIFLPSNELKAASRHFAVSVLPGLQKLKIPFVLLPPNWWAPQLLSLQLDGESLHSTGSWSRAKNCPRLQILHDAQNFCDADAVPVLDCCIDATCVQWGACRPP